MGGDGSNLPLDLEAIADDRREVVEDLGEVAAGLTLGEHGGDEEARVEKWDPFAKRFQRVRHRHAEILPVVRQPELGPHGLRHLFGNHRQAGRKCVSGSQGSREKIDRLGKLFLELGDAALGHVVDEPDGQVTGHHAEHNRGERELAERLNEQIGGDART